MASGQGSRSSGKSAGKKTTAGKSQSRTASGKGRGAAAGRTSVREAEPMDLAIRNELVLIGVLALAIFLFLCNFGVVGVVGDLVSDVMFGIFGLISYAAPVLFFLAVAFGISNKGNRIAVRKLVAAVVLFLLVEMACDLLTGGWNENSFYRAKDLFERCSRNHNGGGLIGGTLAYLSYHFLSMVGTVLLMVVFAVVCLVVITEKSVMSGVKSGGQRVYEKTREDVYNRRERAQRRREEQEQLRREREEERRLREEEEENEKILRMDKKVSGVMLDTTLDGKKKKAKAAAQERNDSHGIVVHGIEESAFKEVEVTAEKSAGDGLPPEFERIHITSAFQDRPEETGGHTKEGGIGQSMEEPDAAGEVFTELQYRPRGSKRVDSDEMQEVFFEPMEMEEEEFGETETKQPEESRILADAEEEGFFGFAQENQLIQSDEDIAYEEPAEDDLFRGEAGEDNLFASMEDGKAAGREEGQFQETSKQRVRPVAKPPALAETEGSAKVLPDVGRTQAAMPKQYMFPSLNLLKKGPETANGDSALQLKQTAVHLQKTLATFGVRVTITDISQGPTVTRYELQPDQGVKVSKIVGLADDIKLNLAATDIRIEAPIPGKAAVGIEVPNKENAMVALRDLLESKEFQEFPSNLSFAVGKDIGGKTVVADIARMPHMLIAGSTGSGKSVCINTLIMSILYKAHPDDVKLIMVDPKVVELSVYNGIPHLMIPVVTDPKKAAAALHWGVAEMTDRYKKFANFNVRDLKGYNKAVEAMKGRGEEAPAKMPQIVIIVDELADLMMVSPGEVEESICRLAQLARAAGIHLIIATQRPSVDVITGLIKANMPSRVAFAVSSGVDSRTILDMNGAEKLLGKGDMLFYPQGYPKPARVQGAFVSDPEVSDVVDFLKNQAIGNVYSEDVEAQIKTMGSAAPGAAAGGENSFDQYFVEAGRFIIEKDKASIGMLQRVFKIGFNRAARIMDQLSDAGVVGEEEGTKPRKVLMSMEEFEQFVEESC